MKKFLIVLLILTLLTCTASAATLTVDDSGGKQYKTIQAAVNAAKSGDTIYVYAGSYPETVTVNRPDMLLYFQGEKTSTCYKYPKVDGFSFWGPAGGNINGFNITKNGISYDIIGNNIVRNNYIYGGGVGFGGQTCSNNSVVNNQLFGCGISFYECYENTVTGNKINKAPIGLKLDEGATCRTITGNTFSYCNIAVQVPVSVPDCLIGNTYKGNKVNVKVVPAV
jgi:nitrous oxidase accessory protein NosD